MQFKIILSIVKPELTNMVIDAAREAGATGDVIIPARGSGSKESPSFLGLKIEDQTELIIFLVADFLADNIMKAICDLEDFNKPGNGIVFMLDVEKVAGLDSQIALLKKRQEDEEK